MNRKPPNAGKGRVKGVPNKATADVRAAIALLAERNVAKLEGWLNRVARKHPEKAADIFLRAIEYHIPRLARTEMAGGVSVQVQRHDLTDDELAQVIQDGRNGTPP
jgi:hypothetical protein